MSATRSPRATPRAASAFERRLAACCRSQKVNAAVDPSSSSQLSARRNRSRDQRAQADAAILKSAGTRQRKRAYSSGCRSIIRAASARERGLDVGESAGDFGGLKLHAELACDLRGGEEAANA